MPYWGLVVTSDSVKKGEKEDQVTPLVRETLERHGETLIYSSIAGNDPFEILHAITAAALAGAEIILVTGGTGPSPRDHSATLVERLADAELPGIGEEFRRRSIERGVKNALLSRAGAYVVHGRAVIVSPGNPDAVREMLEIILPVAGHLVEQLQGRRHSHRAGQH